MFMNFEFHYYITYIVALRVGYNPNDARAIAYSCQYTDDNTEEFEISNGTQR